MIAGNQERRTVRPAFFVLVSCEVYTGSQVKTEDVAPKSV